MSEWWTYTLSDFLLFSPRTYYRLIELHHRDLWPLQPALACAGLALLALAARGGPRAGRAASALAAAAWLWVAWSWLATRYATINWAAEGLAVAFAVEGLLLFAMGTATNRLAFTGTRGVRRTLGVAVAAVALLLLPVAGIALGRPTLAAEAFAITPAPTALATLGLLLLAERTRWELAVIPAAACALDGATLLAMDAPDAWIVPALALAAVLALAIAPPGRTPANGGTRR